MESKLIYSSKINSTELLKTLALNGVNTFNLRIVSLIDLIDDVNMKYGYPIKDHILNNGETEEIAYQALYKSTSLKNMGKMKSREVLPIKGGASKASRYTPPPNS